MSLYVFTRCINISMENCTRKAPWRLLSQNCNLLLFDVSTGFQLWRAVQDGPLEACRYRTHSFQEDGASPERRVCCSARSRHRLQDSDSNKETLGQLASPAPPTQWPPSFFLLYSWYSRSLTHSLTPWHLIPFPELSEVMKTAAALTSCQTQVWLKLFETVNVDSVQKERLFICFIWLLLAWTQLAEVMGIKSCSQAKIKCLSEKDEWSSRQRLVTCFLSWSQWNWRRWNYSALTFSLAVLPWWIGQHARPLKAHSEAGWGSPHSHHASLLQCYSCKHTKRSATTCRPSPFLVTNQLPRAWLRWVFLRDRSKFGLWFEKGI